MKRFKMKFDNENYSIVPRERCCLVYEKFSGDEDEAIFLRKVIPNAGYKLYEVSGMYLGLKNSDHVVTRWFLAKSSNEAKEMYYHLFSWRPRSAKLLDEIKTAGHLECRRPEDYSELPVNL